LAALTEATHDHLTSDLPGTLTQWQALTAGDIPVKRLG
jgi:hypothetical protein